MVNRDLVGGERENQDIILVSANHDTSVGLSLLF